MVLKQSSSKHWRKIKTNDLRPEKSFLRLLNHIERSALSAEHATFGFDKSDLEELSDEAQDEPVLSGLDFSMDGLGSMLDDLNDEKTVPDTGDELPDGDLLPAAVPAADGDERTVFGESFGSLGVSEDAVDALGLDESDNFNASVNSKTGSAVIKSRANDDSGLSVSELGSSDFDRLEPSLMVDIPKMEERVAPASRVEQKRTMMGFPGVGDLPEGTGSGPANQSARPVFPTAKPAPDGVAAVKEMAAAAAPQELSQRSVNARSYRQIKSASSLRYRHRNRR